MEGRRLSHCRSVEIPDQDGISSNGSARDGQALAIPGEGKAEDLLVREVGQWLRRATSKGLAPQIRCSIFRMDQNQILAVRRPSKTRIRRSEAEERRFHFDGFTSLQRHRFQDESRGISWVSFG